MFLLRGTTDQDRSRTATATATQALRHHARMTREGLLPVITDWHGRPMSAADLGQLARLDIKAAVGCA